MFENIMNFFKKFSKNEKDKNKDSSSAAKERLHLVLMQDRANVSADFLELMRQEIIEVIKKYIDIDEAAIDVKLTNKMNDDGTVGAPALYANIPIVTIKNDAKKDILPEDGVATDKKQEEINTENTNQVKQETNNEEETVQTAEKTLDNETNQDDKQNETREEEEKDIEVNKEIKQEEVKK